MANNQYVNKVVFGAVSIIDITPTTAVESDVAHGKVFFKADGSQATGTASGGGGGEYAWFGDGAQKVGTIINRTINLKNDTGYDDWTASTTATTLIPADSNPYYSYQANLGNYDFCFITKGFIEPVYVSGTPTTYRTYRVSQCFLNYFYGYYSSSTIADIQSGSPSFGAIMTISSANIQYFYNNGGTLQARTASQCGPLYMATYPDVSLSSSTLSSGVGTIDYKFPAFYAKCDSSRFRTERKAQVDSANTNYLVTVDLYRVPRGKSMASYVVEQMRNALNG